MKLQTTILRGLQSKTANALVLFFILISILSIILGSFAQMQAYRTLFFAVTYFSSLIFLVEYGLRIYSAPALHPTLSPSKARRRYFVSFYGFVDFVAILPFVLSYIFWDTPLIHSIVLPYIFMIFKLIRHSKSFRLIGTALLMVRKELYTAYTACIIVIFFSAILMYFIEREAQPEAFSNIGDGLWWAVVTFTTTGYGDLYPVTGLGRMLGSIIGMIGIAMIAIPTAIISSSFINIMQRREKERERKENRKNARQDKSLNDF